MKKKMMYEAPEMEVVRIKMEGVIATSVETMTRTTDYGTWDSDVD